MQSEKNEPRTAFQKPALERIRTSHFEKLGICIVLAELNRMAEFWLHDWEFIKSFA